jgi:hypothetical protein
LAESAARVAGVAGAVLLGAFLDLGEVLTFALFLPIYSVAASMLPAKMDSLPARAMLAAIALQESRFEYRRQINGPARGFFQFEKNGGVKGVLTHPATSDHIRNVLDALAYNHAVETSYVAIEHNDVLACAFARLLLWTVPGALPARDDPEGAWQQYLSAWRPGKPHRATWDALYAKGWEMAT